MKRDEKRFVSRGMGEMWEEREEDGSDDKRDESDNTDGKKGKESSISHLPCSCVDESESVNYFHPVVCHQLCVGVSLSLASPSEGAIH